VQEVLVDGGQLAGELLVEQLQDLGVCLHRRPLSMAVPGTYILQLSESSLIKLPVT
jgi:hypothetical protein